VRDILTHLLTMCFRFDRRCVQDTVVNGLKIKKGTMVNIPVYAIHHNTDVWENPEKFEPER